MVRQRSGLGFKGYFLHLVPPQDLLHLAYEMTQLIDRQIGRRPAAKIDKARLAPANELFYAVNPQLAQHRVDVAADRRRILVRVNLEITEVAPLPAKRNVRVNPKVRARF